MGIADIETDTLKLLIHFFAFIIFSVFLGVFMSIVYLVYLIYRECVDACTTPEPTTRPNMDPVQVLVTNGTISVLFL